MKMLSKTNQLTKGSSQFLFSFCIVTWFTFYIKITLKNVNQAVLFYLINSL